MEIRRGIAVSPGVAISEAVVIDAADARIPMRTVARSEVPHELQRLRAAVQASQEEVEALRQRVATQFDNRIADIFAVHLGWLRDRSLMRRIRDAIREKHYTAEYAVSTVFREVLRQFYKLPGRMAERVNDIFDIERRLLNNLLGQKREDLSHLKKAVAVICHDLTPSQTASLDNTKIRGIATDAGGQTSHTAIVARALGIPAVVGLKDVTIHSSTGDLIIIDGNRGVVIIDPDQSTLDEHRRHQRELIRFEHDLDELRDLEGVTLDGERVRLLGNIEFPQEAVTTIEKGGDGIGLYRTEFLYLASESEPSEEQQYATYAETLQALKGKPVVIRTFDLGADKYTQQRSLTPERNPFLGCRSIRYCLRNIPMFKTQLRALLRASVLGDLRILIPLITSLLELKQAKMVLGEVMEDLQEEGIAFNADVPIGIMIETPSSALIARTLAPEVDFFSIGTNDLIQYTLAVDRGNEQVASLFTASHPAVLQLIKQVIRAAKRAKVPVTVCGEMAGQPEYIMLLLGMGVRSLSLAPRAIPEIKKIVRSVTMKEARRAAQRIMRFESAREVTNYVREATRRVIPEAF